MTGDDLLYFFKKPKIAAEKLNCSRAAISQFRKRRPSTPVQIRAFHLSDGMLCLDDEAKRHLDYILGRDIAA